MDPFDASEFSVSGLTFESEFDAFLGSPVNGSSTASDGGTTTSNVSSYHQGFGQPGGRDSQCPGCARYKVDFERIIHEHKINFQLLKKKIINTDLVLRKWKEQKDECDLLRAETEEFKRKMDQATRDSEILSQQLTTAMANIKPLQEDTEHLKSQLELKSRQVIELNDRIEGDMALKLQRTAQDDYNRNLEIEVTKLKKNNTTLAAKVRTMESRVKDLTSEKKGLICSKNVVDRRLDNLAVALHKAQDKCQAYWERLRQHDLITREKRPAFIPNGFKSIVRRAVDKKNGILTNLADETANQAASEDDDNVSLHSGVRNNDSDWDNISDVDSDGDNDVASQKRVEDDRETAQPYNSTGLPATYKSAVIPQKHKTQMESDSKSLPPLKKLSQKSPESSVENTPQKFPPNHSKPTGSRRDETKASTNNTSTLPPSTETVSRSIFEDTACKLSQGQQAVAKPCTDNSQKPEEHETRAATRKDLEISRRFPEAMKIVSESKKTEYSRDISNVSKGKNMVNGNRKLDQLDRPNLNRNRKNGDVDSLDDSSLSSLSSLSSSDDDSDGINDIDEFLNFGSKNNHSQGKGQSLDLDTAFSFAEIQNLLSPLSVSPRPLSSRPVSPLTPRPVSPLLSPHPVPLLPLQAVSELSASPHLASSPISSLASADSTDEADTAADCLFANESASSESQSPPHGGNRKNIRDSDNPQMRNAKAGAVIRVESASRDGECQNVIVSRSQSVGFIPSTEDAGGIYESYMTDESIPDNVSGVEGLQDVNISEDVSDTSPLVDSCVSENVSNSATLVDKSDSEYLSNNATLVDKSDSEFLSNNATLVDKSDSEYLCNNETLVDKSDSEYLSNNEILVDKSDSKFLSSNATLVDKSESGYLFNSAAVTDHSISENMLNITPATDSISADSISAKDTCVEVYILKNISPASLDKLSTQTEVETGAADTCDIKSVIKVTEASDMKSALSEVYKSLNIHVLDLRSPLPQAHQSLDTQSLDLKSPSTLPLGHQPVNTQSSDFKPSPSLPQTHELLNSQALDLTLSSPLLKKHQSLNTNTRDLNSLPVLPPTQSSDIKSSATLRQPQSVHTHTSAIKSSPALPQTSDIKSSTFLKKHQSSNTQASELKSSSTVHQSLNTQASDTKSSSVHQSLNTQASSIKSSSAVHQLSNTQASGIKSSSAVFQPSVTQASDLKSSSAVYQPSVTQASDLKSSSAVYQPSVIQASDLKSSSSVPQTQQLSNIQASDIKSSSAVPQTQLLSNAEASDIKPSLAVHQSLNTQTFVINVSSAVPQTHQSSDTHDIDLKSSSVVYQSSITQASDTKSSAVYQSSITQASDTKSSAVYQPSVTQASDIKSSSAVYQPSVTQASDLKSSSAVPQTQQLSNTQASDIKSSSAVPQTQQLPNTQASDIKSSAVHQSLNTQASDINVSFSVPQTHQSSNTKACDLKSSSAVYQPAVTQASDIKSSSSVHQPAVTQASDIKSSSSVHQPAVTQASDIKLSSSVHQTHQSLLLEVFNFFSLPPLLSPLPPSPCPHKRKNEDMPLVKFKSSTPAKAPKVTPRAKVERRPAVGNNSSMSSQIIEARKLMATRRSAVLKNPVAVTKGGERKRTAAMSEISPAGPTKRRKLANLTDFPNASAAVLYDLQRFLTAKDVDLKMTAETMLSRVVDGNTKAVWEILSQLIVNYLESTQRDVLNHLMSACEKDGVINTVFIREKERRLVLLISAFWRFDETLDRRNLMGKIWTAIFNRDCSNQLVRLSYCRMFTSLCMEQGDLEQARILVYSIAWCDYLDLVHPVMAIVGVWPLVLAYRNKKSGCCIKNVLWLMLRETCKADSSLLHKVTLVLKRLCQFDLSKTDESPEKLLKNLLQQLLHQVQNVISGSKIGRVFEFMKSVELLLVYQGSEWTEKHFIKSNLVSFTMRWENRRLDKTGPPDQFITCLVKIFSAVTTVQPLSTSSLGTVLGTVFPRFLNSTTSDTDMMHTCIDAILELAPHSPDKCLDMLKRWQAAQSNIPAETLSKLQQAQSTLSQKVPPKRNNKGKRHKKQK